MARDEGRGIDPDPDGQRKERNEEDELTHAEVGQRLVLGGEGHGLHEHMAKKCDFLVRIPMAGAGSGTQGVASLNVSVAAGIMLFEWSRRGARS